jgi:aldehyde:ferredoxin oxidoreductase
MTPMAREIEFKIADVNLSNHSIRIRTTSRKDFDLYLGSRGLNAKILFEEVPPGIDPLGEHNLLILSAGTFVGVPVPTAGQLTITAKSPATGLYFKSNTGGAWARALKRAGWDAVMLSGISPEPVYLYIEDSQISIRDASSLWGKSVRETTRELHRQLGSRGLDVAVIGPAGENLVVFATIMTSNYHAAGRGGMGAVMGSKRVKAIAVRGSGSHGVENQEALQSEIVKVFERIQRSKKAELYLRYGTAATIEYANESWDLPVNNFQKSHIDQGFNLGGTYLVNNGYMRNGGACSACPISCHKFSTVRSGKYQGFSGGPEYETLAALGAGCGIIDVEAVLKGNELCNDLGLDTISTGGVIQFLIESVERGAVPKDIGGGLDLRWGNGDTLVSLIDSIAYRIGVGDILAKGTRQAAQEVGGESWKWAVQAHGLEQSRVDTRTSKAYALAFAVNPRGPDHLHAQPIAEFGYFPESRRLVERLLGSEKYCDPMATDKKPELVRWHEDMFAITDSLGICSFATTTSYVIDESSILNFLWATFGIEISQEELLKKGQRTVVLERCFNLRENPNHQDILPWRLMNEPVEGGPFKGEKNSVEELREMLSRYYELQGYDLVRGRPTRKLLSSLGLLGNVQGIEQVL